MSIYSWLWTAEDSPGQRSCFSTRAQERFAARALLHSVHQGQAASGLCSCWSTTADVLSCVGDSCWEASPQHKTYLAPPIIISTVLNCDGSLPAFSRPTPSIIALACISWWTLAIQHQQPVSFNCSLAPRTRNSPRLQQSPTLLDTSTDIF